MEWKYITIENIGEWNTYLSMSCETCMHCAYLKVNNINVEMCFTMRLRVWGLWNSMNKGLLDILLFDHDYLLIVVNNSSYLHNSYCRHFRSPGDACNCLLRHFTEMPLCFCLSFCLCFHRLCALNGFYFTNSVKLRFAHIASIYNNTFRVKMFMH